MGGATEVDTSAFTMSCVSDFPTAGVSTRSKNV